MLAIKLAYQNGNATSYFATEYLNFSTIITAHRMMVLTIVISKNLKVQFFHAHLMADQTDLRSTLVLDLRSSQ